MVESTPLQATPTTSGNPQRNDNSNPQQGTGNMGAANRPGGPGPSASAGSLHPHIRPSLTIPPTIKDARKLFVGGLPTDITDEEFRTFFKQFGTLIDSIVMFDRDTNCSRGFGFVTFEDPEVAHKLLSMGNNGIEKPGKPLIGRMEMRGKTIEIKAAEPKESAPRRNRNKHKPAKNANIHSVPKAFGPAALSDANNMMYTPSEYPYYPSAFPYYNVNSGMGAPVYYPPAPFTDDMPYAAPYPYYGYVAAPSPLMMKVAPPIPPPPVVAGEMPLEDNIKEAAD